VRATLRANVGGAPYASGSVLGENGALPPAFAGAVASLLDAVDYKRAENETLAGVQAAGWRVSSGTGYRLTV
jgi:hypothetical protein